MRASRYAFGSAKASPPVLHSLILTDLPISQPHSPTEHHSVRALNLLCHPNPNNIAGTGIFNLFPIAYTFRSLLRGRLTQGRRTLPWKPWIFGEKDSHLLYRYSCHASSLVYAPILLTVYLHRIYYALLPCLATSMILALYFSPINYQRKFPRLVSCYALFK